MTLDMNRRRFLGVTAGAAGAVAASSVLGVGAAGAEELPNAIAAQIYGDAVNATANGDLTVVTIFLDGGNDTLNTVIPYADPAYAVARPVIAIPSNQVLPLDSTWGLHPNLPYLQQQWQASRLALVHGCGYTQYNRSHFESRDIIMSCGAPPQILQSGWIGRWLEQTGTDPLRAMSVDAGNVKAILGTQTSGVVVGTGNMNIYRSATWINNLRATHEASATTTTTHGKASVGFRDYFNARDRVNAAYTAYPRTINNGFGRDLEAVARLIRGGVPARVFFTSMGGYDTHDTQGPRHDSLMTELNTAISAFFGFLAGTPALAKTVVCVWSEFGRNVRENASAGTDHGEAYTMMLMGAPVRGGHYGAESPVNNPINNALRTTTDYRSVFATLLAGGLGHDPNTVIPNCPPTLNFLT
jgi:uncharacterized protein (DUF1501 family)